jgi:hypothetical protein
LADTGVYSTGTQNNKPLKTTGKILAAVLGAAFFLAGCGKNPATSSSSWSLDESGAAMQLKQFLVTQEIQARALAKQDGITPPADFDVFYRAAEAGDWQDATNLFGQMRQRFRIDSSLLGSWWSATLDADGVFAVFPPGDKYAIAFGNDIIQSVPALMESHEDGRPFFMLSQNPLADVTYLHYLRAMYGGKIHLPSDDDLQKSFENYRTDVERRFTHDQQFPHEPKQLKPDEGGWKDSNGQFQMNAWVYVIGARELLTKAIFDQNPDREFYLEQSFPLDWMYPYLEPHGLILKINRQPLPGLTAEIIQRDSDYWTKYVTPMIGNWLKPDTTIAEVAAFAEKIQVKKDWTEFTGDPQFVQNEDWSKNFSKLRSSIGGLYVWRAQHTTDASEKRRMNEAADFAFRQAWALCPYSLETVFQYVSFLMNEGRTADALLIVETAAKMPLMQDSNGDTLRDTITALKQSLKSK